MFKSIISLAKAAVHSRRPSKGNRSRIGRPIIVMGNGPSLRSFIDEEASGDKLGRLKSDFDLMAVNFAAITPEFKLLRPEAYTLADPHFFSIIDPSTGDPIYDRSFPAIDSKVVMLWEAIRNTDWEMTLFLPANLKGKLRKLMPTLPGNVRVKWYNLTPVEGNTFISRFLISSGLGMPRPRNVLIPAIMNSLREGYRNLFLVGADHSWSKSLWVDNKNRVVSVQPHFYKDNAEEEARVAAEYAGYHIHDILGSMVIAFKSYFAIEAYARSIGAQIFNATPGSFIDAFPRCGYAQMKQLSTM